MRSKREEDVTQVQKIVKLNNEGSGIKSRLEGEDCIIPNLPEDSRSEESPVRTRFVTHNGILRQEGELNEDDKRFIKEALGNHFLFKDNYDTLM